MTSSTTCLRTLRPILPLRPGWARSCKTILIFTWHAFTIAYVSFAYTRAELWAIITRNRTITVIRPFSPLFTRTGVTNSSFGNVAYTTFLPGLTIDTTSLNKFITPITYKVLKVSIKFSECLNIPVSVTRSSVTCSRAIAPFSPIGPIRTFILGTFGERFSFPHTIEVFTGRPINTLSSQLSNATSTSFWTFISHFPFWPKRARKVVTFCDNNTFALALRSYPWFSIYTVSLLCLVTFSTGYWAFRLILPSSPVWAEKRRAFSQFIKRT